MLKNYVGIVRDHSGSMQIHRDSAAADYNQIIAGLKQAARENSVDTIVSVAECSGTMESTVRLDVTNSSVNALNEISGHAYKTYGNTPLWDSVGDIINALSKAPDMHGNNVSFLVIVVTDGEENCSHRWSTPRLRKEIQLLQASDRWSFAFRVPVGYSSKLISFLGVHPGNVLEWEQSQKGFERASAQTVSGLRGYYANIATGQTSTQRFFANPASITPVEVKKELEDISNRVVIWSVERSGLYDDFTGTVSPSIVIKPFCEHMSGEPYVKGRAFYELVKTETVQDHKGIIIRDKETGKVYMGHGARNLLGLPGYGTIRLSPGDHGRYDLFIQSTSLNRVLRPETRVLYITKP